METKKIISRKKIMASLPTDCRGLSSRRYSLKIFHRHAKDCDDNSCGGCGACGKPITTIRMNLPAVWPKDNNCRQGPTLSDGHLRALAWIERGLEDGNYTINF